MTPESELRELDAWIAERIFGWHKVETGDNKSLCSVCGNGLGARHKHYVPEFHGSMTGSVPFYSTDPAAAMEVLQKCMEKDGGAVIYESPMGDGYIMCSDDIPDTFGATLPLCISQFAKQLFSK